MKQEILIKKDYWNKEAKSFQKIYTHKKPKILNLLDGIFRKDMFQRFEFALRNSEPIKNRTFLDVGCGSGRYSVELARRGAGGVVGIDISDEMLRLSRRYAEEEKVENRCTFINEELLQYNPESSFDVSIAIGLFDYLRHPSPALKKLKSLTNHKIIISFPRSRTWRAPIRKIRLALKSCEVFFYTKEKIGELMKEAGFERCSIHTVGQLHCVIGFKK